MKTQTKDLSSAWQISLLMLFCALVMVAPDLAYAGTFNSGDNTVIGNALCRVVTWFTGSTGKGIATIAIIIIGVGALMGKVSWGMAIIVGIGVALIFGAASLVNSISGDAADASNCTSAATTTPSK